MTKKLSLEEMKEESLDRLNKLILELSDLPKRESLVDYEERNTHDWLTTLRLNLQNVAVRDTEIDEDYYSSSADC